MDKRIKNFTGQKFGKLLVVAYTYSKFGNAYWLCECDCGNKKVIPGRNLNNGHTKSCGCLLKEHYTQCFGKNNSNWKGDAVGYFALQNWINRNYPRQGICSTCGKRANTGYVNINGEYKRDITDFIELCMSCHKIYDLNKIKSYEDMKDLVIQRKKSKICTKCGEQKSIKDFNWQNKSKGRRKAWCKNCINELSKKWHQKNQERYKNYQKQYKKDNSEYRKECDKQYRMNNPDKINANTAKRRALKLNQTPLNVNMLEILQIYSICSYMNSISINCKWHVDHIHPLSKGGPHHQDNLQILDSIVNMRKGSKF
ncbi:hypothetical protein LCGC14_1283040 [marine sediment metagenome]|uniref:HNH domain-containing protein n=1 Tax=marine sediment metagenome TaxID=412755 RepID=A0A0F9NB88_9ZZZZ